MGRYGEARSYLGSLEKERTRNKYFTKRKDHFLKKTVEIDDSLDRIDLTEEGLKNLITEKNKLQAKSNYFRGKLPEPPKEGINSEEWLPTAEEMKEIIEEKNSKLNEKRKETQKKHNYFDGKIRFQPEDLEEFKENYKASSFQEKYIANTRHRLIRDYGKVKELRLNIPLAQVAASIKLTGADDLVAIEMARRMLMNLNVIDHAHARQLSEAISADIAVKGKESEYYALAEKKTASRKPTRRV